MYLCKGSTSYLLLFGFQNWQWQSASEGYIQYSKHCHPCPLENQNKQVQTSLYFWQMFSPTLEFLYVPQTHNWFGLDLTDKPEIIDVEIITILDYFGKKILKQIFYVFNFQFYSICYHQYSMTYFYVQNSLLGTCRFVHFCKQH